MIIKFHFLEDEKESPTDENSEKNKDKTETVPEKKSLENGTDNANISGKTFFKSYILFLLD